MTVNRIKIAALGLAAAFATTMTLAATSAPAHAAGVKTASASVAIADLNLASASGQRTLRLRIKHAAESVCTEPAQISLALSLAGRACIKRAVDTVEPEVQAAIARQRTTLYAARAAE